MKLLKWIWLKTGRIPRNMAAHRRARFPAADTDRLTIRLLLCRYSQGLMKNELPLFWTRWPGGAIQLLWRYPYFHPPESDIWPRRGNVSQPSPRPNFTKWLLPSCDIVSHLWLSCARPIRKPVPCLCAICATVKEELFRIFNFFCKFPGIFAPTAAERAECKGSQL